MNEEGASPFRASSASDERLENRADPDLEASVKQEANRLGFAFAGIAPAVSPVGFEALTRWLDNGYAGEMGYLERRRQAYEHPGHVLETVRSVVMLGVPYAGRSESEANSETPRRVARYACNASDYHDVLRRRLKSLAGFLKSQRPNCRTRGVVDTAPLLERDFARLAGLGWFGKNTMLIRKRQGSWFFLCGLLTDLELKADAPHETSHCGTCTRCLDACPTDAFPAPYELDARRCISYLTIELRDRPVPVELRPGMGEWIFGCDICQDVCPWNGKAPAMTDADFAPAPELPALDPVALLAMSPAEFKARFASTPLSRPGRAGLLRNAAIALGNSVSIAKEQALPALRNALDDVEPLIRGAAAWALGQRENSAAIVWLEARREMETNDDVLNELASALQTLRTGE